MVLHCCMSLIANLSTRPYRLVRDFYFKIVLKQMQFYSYIPYLTISMTTMSEWPASRQTSNCLHEDVSPGLFAMSGRIVGLPFQPALSLWIITIFSLFFLFIQVSFGFFSIFCLLSWSLNVLILSYSSLGVGFSLF